jgi:hypothetical protein
MAKATTFWTQYEWCPADGTGHCETWQAGPFKNKDQADKFSAQLHTIFSNEQIKNLTIGNEKTKGVPNIFGREAEAPTRTLQ